MPPLDELMTLELKDQMDYHRRAWKLKRVGWTLMAVFFIAGCIGLLGTGPLGRRTVRTGSGLTLHYEKFLRHDAPGLLELEIPPGGPFQVSINDSFVAAVQIEQIHPRPQETVIAEKAHVWVFARSDTETASTIRVDFKRKRPVSPILSGAGL